MRRLPAVLAVTLVCAVLLAQRPQRPPRFPRTFAHPLAAEGAVKQAVEQLGNDKKAIERDLQVLKHLRGADLALADDLQPSVAVQKAFEEVSEAERLNADFTVRHNILRARQELEAARRSPVSSDFGKLRGLIRAAIVSSSRLVVRNAQRLQEESLAWLSVQEQIATHLRMLAEITGESLRASLEEGD